MTTMTEVFPCFFLSCKTNARVKPPKTGTARTLPNFCVVLGIFCVVLCIFLSFSVLFMCTELLPPGGYPIAVKYIISYYIKSSFTLHIIRLTGTAQIPKTRQPGRKKVAANICSPAGVPDFSLLPNILSSSGTQSPTYSMGTAFLSRLQSGRSVIPTTQRHLAPRFRISTV